MAHESIPDVATPEYDKPQHMLNPRNYHQTTQAFEKSFKIELNGGQKDTLHFFTFDFDTYFRVILKGWGKSVHTDCKTHIFHMAWGDKDQYTIPKKDLCVITMSFLTSF